MAIDLHIHSTASDGTVPPGKLPEMAAAAKLSAIALTDHDTVSGVAEFMSSQPEFPQIKLISGVEFSSRFDARELHIVGLFIDKDNPVLQKFLSAMRDSRLNRADLMQQKLKSLGYEISWDDLRAAGMQSDVPGRPHFAEVLVKKYNFPDNQSVFDQLLKRGAAGYVPRELPESATAIQVIKAAGGVAVWAHFLNSKYTSKTVINRTLTELKIAGLDALEAYYTEYTPTRQATALRIAEEHALAVSGGSDYHGSIHPEVKLGIGRGNLLVPDEVLTKLEGAGKPKVLIV